MTPPFPVMSLDNKGDQTEVLKLTFVALENTEQS